MSTEYIKDHIAFSQVCEILDQIDPLLISKTLTMINYYYRQTASKAEGIDKISDSPNPLGSDSKDSSSISIKDFLHEKSPKKDGEKIACLGYYLTKFMNQPEFGVSELSQLIVDAGHKRFVNPSATTGNAVRDGYLVKIDKGLFKMHAFAEKFVEKLPDFDAAKGEMPAVKRKRRNPKKKGESVQPEQQELLKKIDPLHEETTQVDSTE